MTNKCLCDEFVSIFVLILLLCFCHIITMTSWWAQFRLKSPASRLFAQTFARAHIKENIKAPRHWPLWGESTGESGFPSQRTINAENVPIWWRHHGSGMPAWHQGFYSPTRRTSYRKISWNLEAARFRFRLFQSLRLVITPDLAASRLHEICKASHCLVNREVQSNALIVPIPVKW